MAAGDFALKRSMTPYLGELLIIGVITIGLIYTSIKTSTWMLLAVAFGGWSLAVVSHYADFRYRVFWRDGAVERIATNNSITTIKASDISRVALEKADVATLLTLSRPKTRITVYGKDREHLDVSLRHFVAADIRKLMQEIHKKRPDLSLPEI